MAPGLEVGQATANPANLYQVGEPGVGQPLLLWLHTFFIFFPHLQQLPAANLPMAACAWKTTRSNSKAYPKLVGNVVLSLKNSQSLIL